ncbi:hypothetical protein EVJ58_g8440 [Rhodofomes roseus]|uniref:Uncharacterized protein n=1 Tax=Rhodofomes roseus TaxID=34475 RepID=A0A4Y9XZL6_9APHY|nr:hypothetical protein EVJ58_g8440 [Rhodofomes roseus]
MVAVASATVTGEPDGPIDLVRDDPLISTIDSLYINISRPVPDRSAHAWAASMPGYLQNIDVRTIEFNLGTFISDSFQLDSLNFSLLDSVLTLLVSRSKRPEVVVTFRMRVQLAEDNLCLVCCAWVPTTRLHKLRAVTLRTPARCLWLETLLDSPLVNSADIPLCVGELTVGANPNDTQYDSADTGAVWEHPGLVPLLCRFARVQCLRLDNLKWSPGAFPPRAARQFMAAFPRLKRLVMKVAVFHSPEDLLLLLSAFPLLTSVAVSFVSWFNQDVVTHWTTSPRRPRKQSSEPIVLSLKSFTTDPTSYIAVITAASVSQNTWRLALDELEWIGHEKFHSDWMLARAYEQSAAFINPLSDITAHLFAVEGRGKSHSRAHFAHPLIDGANTQAYWISSPH